MPKLRLRQSMRSYLRNIRGKFYPDPIWNDGALWSVEEVAKTKEEEEQDE